MSLSRRTRGLARATAIPCTALFRFTEKGGNMDDAMKRWMESCKPGAHHRELERFVGSWDMEIEMTSPGMGPPGEKAKGSAECKWLVEGKWIVTDAKDTFMGMPIQSHAAMG